jgi:hypothetical protein
LFLLRLEPISFTKRAPGWKEKRETTHHANVSNHVLGLELLISWQVFSAKLRQTAVWQGVAN